MRLLLDSGAQVNNQTKDGIAPLGWAAFKGRVECVKLLLEKGADPNHQDKDGDTALHLAAFDKPDVSNHLICVKLLLSQPGVNPLVMNKKGVTPLAHAAIGIRVMYQNIAERILRFPVHKYVKVVLCGHSGAGKSTLTQLEEAKGLESVGWLQIDSNLLVMVEIVTVTTMRND
ncbi:hypothetical protein EMCRGX_G000397 [Ephydatia muelleri]